MKKPNLDEEIRHWAGGKYVIGVDEVGRGAFAGPLVVGGVIFKPTRNEQRLNRLLSYGINDSKKLNERSRNELYKVIYSEALYCSTIAINANAINTFGIAKSTHTAVRKLVKQVFQNLKPHNNLHLLMDAFYIPYVDGIGRKNQTGIVKGDEKSLSIAAASIIAKVTRDTYMKKVAKRYPKYLFENNVGYGTAAHRDALKQYGPTRLHRTLWVSRYI